MEKTAIGMREIANRIIQAISMYLPDADNHRRAATTTVEQVLVGAELATAIHPRYILEAKVVPATVETRKPYTILRLADGHEYFPTPIYHPIPRGRYKGPYTLAEALSVVGQLRAADADKEVIRRGQAARAGFAAEPEYDHANDPDLRYRGREE